MGKQTDNASVRDTNASVRRDTKVTGTTVGLGDSTGASTSTGETSTEILGGKGRVDTTTGDVDVFWAALFIFLRRLRFCAFDNGPSLRAKARTFASANWTARSFLRCSASASSNFENKTNLDMKQCK
jgi:hypothetical protein